MATDLNPNYSNNINTVAIRAAGTVVHRYTDRAIDVSGNGAEEVASEGAPTERGGSKVSVVTTIPAGVARTLVDQTTETDGGIDKSGEEFTEGVE